MSLGVSTQKPQGNSGMKKIIIRAPRIIKEPYDQCSCEQWYKVIYYDGEKNVKTWFANTLGVDIAQGLQDLAFKDKSQNKGTIMRKDAVKMLQEVFSRHGDLKEFAGRRNRSSRQYGGILASVKALFDLYMDKDSDGGENITQKEQFEIMKTVDLWHGYNYDSFFGHTRKDQEEL